MCTGARRTRRGVVVALAAIAIAACTDRDPVMPGSPEDEAPRLDRTLGVIEVTISGIGGEQPGSSVLSAASVAELAALRAMHSPANGGGASMDLRPPAATVGGNGTIQLELVSTGSFTEGDGGNGGVRYIWADYRVRNAQKDGTAYDTERKNLTFLAVDTDGTIAETAISRLRRFDNSNANAAIAVQILPTGAVKRDLLTNDVISAGPDVLQLLSEEEAGAVSRPVGVKDVFPYGFMVRRAGNATTRTLPASPAADQFDGVVSFAFKIPLQANPSDDPFTISFIALAVDDDETRITQSLEEQSAAGQSAFEARAAALGASRVTQLPGAGYNGAIPNRLICSARIAGSKAAPVASIGSSMTLLSLTPNSGKIAHDTRFSATFSAPVSGVDHTNFRVRGSISGPAFAGKAYDGNGTTTITAPAGNFVPGEEVEVVIDGVPCVSGLPHVVKLDVAPEPFTESLTFSTGNYNPVALTANLNGDGKLDVIVLNRSSNTFTAVLNADGAMGTRTEIATPVGVDAYGLTVGDLNGDGVQDVVVVGIVPNVGSSMAETYLGKGDGTFQYAGRLAVGRAPQYVALGDLNGDGKLDIATSNLNGQSFSVALGNGNGTFQPATSHDVGGNSYYVGFGDLDKDGKLDVVVTAYEANRLYVYWGNGAGGFDGRTELPTAGPGGALAADLNGDGHLDLVSATEDGYAEFFPGNGTRTFGAPKQTMLAGSHMLNYMAAADLDGDGDLDLAITTFAPAVSILINDGTGSFTERMALPLDPAEPGTIGIGDLNGDGKPDLVTSIQSNPGKTYIFWNN